jgi:hypothetical protein
MLIDVMLPLLAGASRFMISENRTVSLKRLSTSIGLASSGERRRWIRLGVRCNQIVPGIAILLWY